MIKKIAMGGTKGHNRLSLKPTNPHKGIVIGIALFLLCTCTGIIAGTHIKRHIEGANAASSNITVANNNQVVTEDQGTPTITRTSTVTIKDTTAILGYSLSARIANNSIPNATVTIYPTTAPTSPATSPCTQSSPCTLTTSSTPTNILETSGTTTTPNQATQPQGHTTDFAIAIALPQSTPLGNYLLDIEYTEDPIVPTTLTPLGDIQSATKDQCDATPLGTTTTMKDTRDNTYYRIRKMNDGNCWMVDNLAYSLLQGDAGTTPNTGAPTYSPAAVRIYGTTASVINRAQYVTNTTAYNIPNNGTPKPSYLYTWCAALGDTSTNCSASASAVLYQTVTNGTTNTTGTATTQPEVTGICPAPFRLPKGGPATVNEFAKLNIAIGGTNTFPNFTTDNTGSPELFWMGGLSGYYLSGLNNQGANGGYWWSSTAYAGTFSYSLFLRTSNSSVSSSNYNQKRHAFAVRCIL